jgi:hypothetical protein
MRIFFRVFALLAGTTVLGIAVAGEPPAGVSLKNEVRMSTLIVMGQVDKIGIVTANSQSFIRSAGELGDNEKVAAEIKIDRVLYVSSEEAPFYSSKDRGNTVTVVFGSRGMDVPDNFLKGRQLIFFLTSNVDRSTAYRYPFYDWSNLCVPADKEGEVTRFIAAFDAIK